MPDRCGHRGVSLKEIPQATQTDMTCFVTRVRLYTLENDLTCRELRQGVESRAASTLLITIA